MADFDSQAPGHARASSAFRAIVREATPRRAGPWGEKGSTRWQSATMPPFTALRFGGAGAAAEALALPS
jgi:hypothetical protein